MSMVSSKLGVGAFEGGIAIGFGLLNTIPSHQYPVQYTCERETTGMNLSKEDIPVAVSLLALIMLGRVL